MYRLYPSLLNTFSLYHRQILRADGSLMVSYKDLLNAVNRVKTPPTEAQQKGVSFENALLKGKGVDFVSPELLQTMRGRLPQYYRTQVYACCQIKDALIYGYADVVGDGRVIDIKTTSSYTPEKFLHNHQNLYLLGLSAWKVQQMEFLITDFTQIYQEIYPLADYDFQPLITEVEAFCDFLEENRNNIRDRRVFKGKQATTQLNLGF
jgi:hypothetical protein